MAHQTKSIYSNGSRGHHKFTLYVTDEWYDIPSNQTLVRWQFVLSPLGNDWDWYHVNTVPVTYIVNIADKRYDGNIMSFDGRGDEVVASGELLVLHDSDGTKDIDFNFSIWSRDEDYLPGSASANGTMTLTPIPRRATITSAPNFYDEQNPTMTFSNNAGNAVTELAVGIYDINGKYPYAAYRTLTQEEIERGSYTFNLTSEERSLIYEASKNLKTPLPLQFYIRTTIGNYVEPYAVERTVEIINANPVIDSTNVLALGRGNTVISGHNYMEFSFEAHGVKGASIARKTVTCGGKTAIIDSNDYGALENVESGEFIFTVEDTRGNSTSVTVEKDFIPYVKPTCNINVDMDIVEGSTAEAKLDIQGIAYGGVMSNETANYNSCYVGYRWKTSTSEYCDWIILDVNETFSSYSYNITIPNLKDSVTYTFQAIITDHVYTEDNPVLSNEYSARAIPVFDWGEDDFNFNVPVTIQGKKAVTTGMKDRLVKVITHEAVQRYDGNSFINLYRTDTKTRTDVIYNTDIAEFDESGSGLITIKKDMLAFVNIHICAYPASGATRSWIKLVRRYENGENAKYVECINYGTFTTSVISTIIPFTSGTVIGVITAEPMAMNTSGFDGSYIEIIEL